MELESKLGEEIDKELEVMSSSELIRVQVDHFQFFFQQPEYLTYSTDNQCH